jgi:hypothetical protein
VQVFFTDRRKVGKAGEVVGHLSPEAPSALLAEWDQRVAAHPATRAQGRDREDLAKARADLRESRATQRRLQQQLDAAATVIATLAAENAALREQAGRSAVVIPLARSRT